MLESLTFIIFCIILNANKSQLQIRVIYMKKAILLFLSVLVFLAAVGCSDIKTITIDDLKRDKLKVTASFYPMYDFAKKIGGDKINVLNMVPAGTEPHDYEPAVSDIINLESADVFIYNGAGLENWTEKVLSSLKNKHLAVVEASKGVSLLTVNEEDAHAVVDSHVWLNPLYAKTELLNIKDAFVEKDPENAAWYEDNYSKYAEEMVLLYQQMKDTLSICKKKEIVVSHQAYGYLCEAFGLKQLGITGLEAESEPDPARMAEIIDFVKQKGVKVIFSEELLSPKIAETIARETGAATEVLNPLEGLSEEDLAAGEDYFSVMQSNINKLKKALN